MQNGEKWIFTRFFGHYSDIFQFWKTDLAWPTLIFWPLYVELLCKNRNLIIKSEQMKIIQCCVTAGHGSFERSWWSLFRGKNQFAVKSLLAKPQQDKASRSMRTVTKHYGGLGLVKNVSERPNNWYKSLIPSTYLFLMCPIVPTRGDFRGVPL